jgi:arginyl-tRNA--protein-N-Asp/Glu arginylyltransferase
MRLFSSEVGQNYDSYTFGYANYCEREPADALAMIYQSGYLPYSGTPHITNIFYMARSARVDLKDFELTSENRRIAKKFDGQFVRRTVDSKDISNTDIRRLFLDYFKERHGNVMPEERLDMILNSPLPLRVISYEKDGQLVGAVLEITEGSMGHFWFSAYDLTYVKTSLGLWLMIDCLRNAKATQLEQYYLGTVYGEKALYKTNFEPLLWWDGSNWNADITILKELGRSDAERALLVTDTWKHSHKPWE